MKDVLNLLLISGISGQRFLSQFILLPIANLISNPATRKVCRNIFPRCCGSRSIAPRLSGGLQGNWTATTMSTVAGVCRGDAVHPSESTSCVDIGRRGHLGIRSRGRVATAGAGATVGVMVLRWQALVGLLLWAWALLLLLLIDRPGLARWIHDIPRDFGGRKVTVLLMRLLMEVLLRSRVMVLVRIHFRRRAR